MSFQVNLNNERKTPEDQTPSSTAQLVRYQGRQVAITQGAEQIHQMISPPLSFMDKIFLGYSSLLEMDPSRFSSHFPRPLLKLFKRMDVMFQQMQEPIPPRSNAIFSLLGPRQLTVEEEVAIEEEKEGQQGILCDALQEVFHKLGNEKNQQIALAGVTSYPEFLKKKERIASYRAAAEHAYLKDASHVERRKQLDVYILQAYKGALTNQEKRIIHQYWEYLATASECNAKMASVHARSEELFMNSIVESIDELLEKMMVAAAQSKRQGHEFKKANFVENYFKEIAQKTRQKVIEERQRSQDPQEQLVLDYLLLTGECQMSLMINTVTRKMLMAHVEEVKKQVEMRTNLARYMNTYQIKEAQERILNLQQEILAAQQKLLSAKQIDNEDEDFIKKYERMELESEIEYNTRRLVSEQSILQTLQADGEADFSEEGLRIVGENPQELMASIPVETSFDKIMLKIMNLETQSQASKILEGEGSLFQASPDLMLNLDQIQDPVEYFLQQIAEKDLEKLKLLRPKVEEIGN